MNHVDLFSGIGGFALAARNTWGGAYRNICFCEINKYAQEVLRKNFGKDVVISDDIRKLTVEWIASYPKHARLNASKEAKKNRIAQCEGKTGAKLSIDESEGVNLLRTKNHKGEKDADVTDSNSSGCVHGKSKKQSAKGPHKAQREPITSVGSPGLRIDLLTGGFPCQPFSQAGQRRGTEDDRFLWPQMLRVISEFKPTWIIGENVAGLLSMAEFDGESEVASETDLFGNKNDITTKRGRGILFRIIGELEQIGYSVQTFVIPACAVNAPHRRDRVWIVAHNSNPRLEGSIVEGPGLRGQSDRAGSDEGGMWRENWLTPATEFCRVYDGLSDFMDRCFSQIIGEEDYVGTSKKDRAKGLSVLREAIQQEPLWEGIGGIFKVSEKEVLLSFLFHIENQSIGSGKPMESEESSSHKAMCGMWNESTFARSPQGRESSKQQAKQLTSIVPELSCEIARLFTETWRKVNCAFSSIESPKTEELSKAGHRVERLKALGNAIVPQVAQQIMEAIKETGL